MSDETIQMIAAAVVALAQIYALNPDRANILAAFWDLIAVIAGGLANILGWWAMYARRNYYLVVNSGS